METVKEKNILKPFARFLDVTWQVWNTRFRNTFTQIFKKSLLIWAFSRLMKKKPKTIQNVTKGFEKQLVEPKI